MAFKEIRALALDFDGVFTDNRVLIDQYGTESVFVSRSDGMGIALIQTAGIPLIVISSETNPVVSARCKKLKLSCEQGIFDKLETLKKWAGQIGISIDSIAFVGNDINDIECMKAVGLWIAVADAHPAALDAAGLVLSARGGYGAIRELSEYLLGPESHRFTESSFTPDQE